MVPPSESAPVSGRCPLVSSISANPAPVNCAEGNWRVTPEPALKSPVDRHAIVRGRRTPHRDAVGHTVVGKVHRHAGHQAGQLGDTHVGEVAVGIHRDDALHVVRVLLCGQRGGGALAIGADIELAQPVHIAGEVEIPGDRRAVADRYGLTLHIQPGVGDDNFMHPIRQAAKPIIPGVIGLGRTLEPRQLDRGPAEQIARGLIAHPAREAAVTGVNGRRLRAPGVQTQAKHNQQNQSQRERSLPSGRQAMPGDNTGVRSEKRT